MNIAVGLMEGMPAVEVEFTGTFTDSAGKRYAAGRHRFTSEVALSPSDFDTCAFALDEITIGIGFHWERKERQVFRGIFRIIKRNSGLSVINDVPLEEYVTSVISSEMSASCPIELLKAHAVISRSWLLFPKARPSPSRRVVRVQGRPAVAGSDHTHEISRWYGRESHSDFDVCADDHCQRYQGITKAFSETVADAVRATTAECLVYNGIICDARFSKCCGAVTECYSTAWEDEDIPYLSSIYDGTTLSCSYSPESLIRFKPAAYCNTNDTDLLGRILPGFDQETRDFYRWRVEYSGDELRDLIDSRLGLDLGRIYELQPLARGPSGRIYRLKITGEKDYVIIGKELEIRRALSRSHLYSSAFVVDKEANKFVLIGAGWGHGVGLCQIGAAVMANEGKDYRGILVHYYRGTDVSTAARS